MKWQILGMNVHVSHVSQGCQLLRTGDYAHSADRPYFARMMCDSELNIRRNALSRVKCLARERVGAKLEMQDLARGSFTTFRVKRSSSAVGSPQALSLPSSLRIIDPAVHPLGVE